MKTSFGLQDQVYDILINDPIILDLLGNPTNDEEKNLKIRREIATIDVIEPESLDFISVYIIDALPSKNYKVNRAVLVVDYFTSLRYNAMRLAERAKVLLEDNLDITLSSEGQQVSGIVGVYQYRQRYLPLIWG